MRGVVRPKGQLHLKYQNGEDIYAQVARQVSATDICPQTTTICGHFMRDDYMLRRSAIRPVPHSRNSDDKGCNMRITFGLPCNRMVLRVSCIEGGTQLSLSTLFHPTFTTLRELPSGRTHREGDIFRVGEAIRRRSKIPCCSGCPRPVTISRRFRSVYGRQRSWKRSSEFHDLVGRS